MRILLFFAIALFVLALTAWKVGRGDNTVSWYLNNTEQIGGFHPLVFGSPVVKVKGKERSIYFNGVNDGLIIPTIPIEGWNRFTIELLFKPDGDGTAAPRLLHFEDTLLNRGTFELRLTRNNQWYFDGFLKNGKTRTGVTLIDSLKLHPVNNWYWAALVYDGRKMYSYINGQKEIEAEMNFPAMTKGKIALGVRLNGVNWFKGQIGKVLFHSYVIAPKNLQHLKSERPK